MNGLLPDPRAQDPKFPALFSTRVVDPLIVNDVPPVFLFAAVFLVVVPMA